MSTLEELMAEAAELYPESRFIQFGDRRLDPHEVRFITAGKRAAHVRAKTISPQQVEDAAEERYPGLFTLSDREYGREFDNPASYRAEHQQDVLDEAKAMFEAAGFYVGESA